MIQASNAYKELVKSNIRPKAEPIVKVSGKDNNGNDIELIWRAKNIKDLKYKRGIDPAGRELPYMELTWTEIYTGKLNAENYPEKYNNIIQYMQVELSFVQDLGFYNTWKTLFSGEITWKDLFNGNIKWKQLKNQVSQETIIMPKLFLSGKPTISGQTITWTARDLLYFLDNENTKSFRIKDDDAESFRLSKNIFSYFLIESRASFLKNEKMFDAISQTVKNALENNDDFAIEKNIIFDGKTKDILKNLSTLENKFLNFKNDILFVSDFSIVDNNVFFASNILFENPKIKQGSNISGYNFKSYKTIRKTNEVYEINPTVVKIYYNDGQSLDCYRWDFEGYGELVESEDSRSEINYYLRPLYSTPDESNVVSVIPISFNGYDNFINNNKNGDTFNENNPINIYDKDTEIAKSRLTFLDNYFNENNSTIEFVSLPNFIVEPSDMVTVETSLYDENDEKILKKGIITSMEINYAGVFKQKISCHEVQI